MFHSEHTYIILEFIDYAPYSLMKHYNIKYIWKARNRSVNIKVFKTTGVFYWL